MLRHVDPVLFQSQAFLDSITNIFGNDLLKADVLNCFAQIPSTKIQTPSIGRAIEVSYNFLLHLLQEWLQEGFDFHYLCEENDMLGSHRKRAPTSYPSGNSSIIEEHTHTERAFKYPIIIVPQTDESAINNSNIAKFLTDGNWEEPNENGPDVQHIRHLHTVKGKTLDFDIVAVTSRLKEEDWNHVVAIFLSGKKWQLKSIPGNDPSQIFKRFTGIYVTFDNQRPNDDVSKWNVKTFNISHTNRFLDSQVSTKIWQEIETVISLKKERKNKY